MNDRPKPPSVFADFMNKIVSCDLMTGETLSGVLVEQRQYELILIDTKDLKSKTPKKTLVFKHGVVSIREME